MRNLFTATTTSVIATASAGSKTTSRKPDLLDVLLKLSHTEREAVMKELKEGNKMVDKLDVVYGSKDKKDSGGLLFMA
ncbi:hypothetical protein STRATTON_154 [Erwinia phage vB_EamM_Stratton]|uniref:Uncharacterized protein n=2 Tax=Erskinevirus EaH2 TaxID=2169883 RepID=A0A1B2IH40_9CAUD|nr:hypothetical protein G173_gp057 [Erwinia phage phiEaH2]AFQ96602.1 hypothetical protein [Erwinia phage phiEaH2]ANZ50579.1 hypothetical protein STRATTON_154 [Erwinia phage vB_EamM_Stratton]